MMNKQNDFYPELFSDEDVEKIVDKIWGKCWDKDCINCPCKNEVETEVCKVDIILELYRKWKNEKIV